MKVWIPVALGGAIFLAYAFFYTLSSADASGAGSIGLVNSVGLVAVFLGLIVAGLLLRRATPHQ
jgi:hypothetical protein